MYYSPKVIDKVKELDLLSYLKNYEPDELVEISRDNYCTKTHDSLKISNGKWYWFSKGFGGYNALDYLIKVKGHQFKNAVEILLNHTKINPPTIEYQENPLNKKLLLPKKNNNNSIVINYLKDRGIDEDIIKECIDKEIIYEEKEHHNIVFIGADLNRNPRYAFIRGCNNTRFMKEAYGSHKAFSFHIDSVNDSNELHLFESAIDLLSYATLEKIKKKEWYNLNLLSLAGIYKPTKNIEDSKLPLALNLYLNNNPNIKTIYLHLDNDATGRLATIALTFAIPKKYEVIDEPPKYGKDINDFLCSKLNINYKNYKEMER